MESLKIKAFGAAIAVPLLMIGTLSAYAGYQDYGNNSYYDYRSHDQNHSGNHKKNKCYKPGNGYGRGNDNGNGYGNTKYKPGNGDGYCKNNEHDKDKYYDHDYDDNNHGKY